MGFNYKCSICGKQDGRRWNADRHLKLVHGGEGEAIDITGRYRGNGIPALQTDSQRLLKSIVLMDNENYLGELARLRARADYKSVGERLCHSDDPIELALKRIKIATSSKPVSVSKVVEMLTGLARDYDFTLEEAKTIKEEQVKVLQAKRQPTLNELLKGRDPTMKELLMSKKS